MSPAPPPSDLPTPVDTPPAANGAADAETNVRLTPLGAEARRLLAMIEAGDG